ncbi:MAG: Unknown protein [uncultured Sulfurovum sp.]|uniref:Uncharacterized protein n=1 Tax=uncultured Sulfurovum sp. TaxID=269237 RepID=A0A6S6TD12_9BACT|nr:MAG: Unknown protein [uncultured Sulfurovum sp.]
MKKIIKLLAVVTSMLLFTACGGGGSGGTTTSTNSLTYKGKTTAADLDEAMAKEFIKSLDISDTTNVGNDSTDNIQKVSNLLEKSNKQVNGSVSGSIDVTSTNINSAKTKTIATFSNYNDNSEETLNGKITYLITVEAEVISSMDMDFELLEIKDNDIDITMDGLIKIVVDNSTGRQTVTQNIVVENNEDNSMIKFEKFIITLDSNDRELSYSGKIYNSDIGYVTVSTPVELTYDDNGNVEAGGEILYVGKDTTVKEKTAYDNSIRVEIDEGSNGSVDEVAIYNSATYEIIENREPVISITFPENIYTDTDMSDMKVDIYDPDLDAFSTEYEWSVDDSVKSTSLTIANELFKKHETLKLKVMASDDRAGDVKIGVKSKEQEVLNSKPIASISSNAIDNKVSALDEIQFDVSETIDKDNDPLTYNWEVYKYVHESESGEAEGELVREDTLSLPEYNLYKVDASKYFNDTSIEKPIYKVNSEGEHVVKCIVFDDDLASDEAKVSLTNGALDSIEEGTQSKVLFPNQDDLYESTYNTVKVFDLNNDSQKEFIFLTRNPLDYTGNSLLHITSNLKGESTTISYIVNIYTSDKIEFVDFNGNSRVDIILIGDNNRYVMTQNLDGSFEDPLEIELNRGVIYMDDFNADGITDTAKLIDCTLNIFTDFNDSTKVIKYDVDSCEHDGISNALSIGDFNSDGTDDFIVLTNNNNTFDAYFVILHKNQNNSLSESRKYSLDERIYGETISIGDVNGDGFNDVVIDFVLFENQKDFNFNEVKTLDTYKNGSTNSEIVIIDMNNDKKEEIFYENAGDLRVFLQEDNFKMNEFKVQSVIPSRVITDIDNDGKIEIIENYANKVEITSFK